jgi:hypothetical protein
MSTVAYPEFMSDLFVAHGPVELGNEYLHFTPLTLNGRTGYFEIKSSI